MTHDELVTNLGTIAHSGSVEFLKAIAAGQAKDKSDLSLIGQFGVGFYSAFMIADRVRVRTRSYTEETGWEWESDGTGTFTVTPVDGQLPRGTEVILHLKEDAKDFAADWRIKEIVRRYSSFVPHPIRWVGGEVINDQKPIWVEPKSQVTEEQYTAVLPAPDPPPRREAALAPAPGGRLADPVPRHRLLPADEPRAAGLRPARARPEPLRQAGAGAVRVPRAGARIPAVPPRAGRFRGPAAERLARDAPGQQRHPQDPHVRSSRACSTGSTASPARTSPTCSGRSTASSADAQGGAGRRSGEPRADRQAAPVRSSRSDDPTAIVSLDEYIARMPDGQKRIYYLGGPDLASIAKSPNLEIFRRRGLEVLFLTDPIDEFAITALGSYQGKTLTSIDSADLELPEYGPGRRASSGSRRGRPRRAASPACSTCSARPWGIASTEVRESKRLTDSPCCLVNAEGGLEHPDAADPEAGQQGIPRDRRRSSRSTPRPR